MLKPYRRAGSTTCRQCMCAVARRLTGPDSRPRFRNHPHDTGVIVCRLALSPHRRSSLCSHSLDSNLSLDAARRRSPLHRIARPGARAGRFGACRHRARQPNCRGWVSAVGVVTADSPRDFDEFARGRQLGGATIVLDSSGGSVNDSIALGRRWRNLGALTTVGTSVQTQTAQGDRASIAPEAYCESMCVFLLLSGKTRYVPDAAHVRVHQIWMGDRADDAKAASYSAQDLMIVERDIGRLAKYTFDMGGAGDLLSLSLNVAPWDDLHELSPAELRLTNLVTTDAVAEVLPQIDNANVPVAEVAAKPVQDRFVSKVMETETNPQSAKSTKTAEAAATGGVAAAPAK